MGREYTRIYSPHGPTHFGGGLILYDDFESKQLDWDNQLSTAGRLEITTTRSFSGSGSLKLFETSAGAVGQWSRAERVAAAPTTQGLLLRLYWSSDNDGAAIGDPTFGISWPIGDDSYTFRIKIVRSGQKLQYMDAAGNWVDLVSFVQNIATTTWHYFELVVDVLVGQYVRVRHDAVAVDMAGKVPPFSLGEGNAGCVIQLGYTKTAAVAARMLLDEVVVEEA